MIDRLWYFFIIGAPEFTTQPPRALYLTEGSNLQMRVEMDGNPKPSADFRWPNLTNSPDTNVPGLQLYPFVYSSTYTLNSINASFCGRILQTALRNSIGASPIIASTNVTVLSMCIYEYCNFY